jgi:hypothetical protein
MMDQLGLGMFKKKVVQEGFNKRRLLTADEQHLKDIGFQVGDLSMITNAKKAIAALSPA